MILSDYPSQISGTPLPDNYKIFLRAFELIDPDMLRGAVLVRAAGL
jgi:hypothetical protein